MSRVVLVTGGTGGLGRAAAARFRADGDTVIITGRDASRLAEAAEKTGARPVPCDGGDPEQVAQLADEVGSELDVLVNMAGGNTDFSAPGGNGDDLGQVAAAWHANLDANLLSAVLTTTAVMGKMRPGGSIVNVGTIGAEYATTSYGAAKAALAAWTAGLSSEAGPKGLTANLIAPGYIEGTDFFRGLLSEERRSALIARTHDGRPGQPSDVAETVHFLASPGARHITGQTIHINGGAHTTR